MKATIYCTRAEGAFLEALKTAMAAKKAGEPIRLHLIRTNWTKSGKPRGLTDEVHQAAIAMLRRYGVPYVEGNDAPRGGQKGRFIEIRVDRRKSFWTAIGL